MRAMVLSLPLALVGSVATPRFTEPSPSSPPPAQEGRVNRPPRVEPAKPSCVPPGGRPLVCAEVLDDGSVAEVRALFRAEGASTFYSTVMLFDGTRYCAWLPAPLPQTQTIEVYVEGVDDEYELSRGRTHSLSVRPACVVAPEEASAAPTAIRRTTPGQSPLPAGFDPTTMRGQK
jgi:hypothetical protein